MKCTSGFYAFVSVLALACSGSSNSGGAGGAGGGAMAAQQPPQQATTASGVKLGSDPVPKNPAGDPSNASGNVGSSTQPPPSNPNDPPASSTDSFPGEGIAGGGDCAAMCKGLASKCPEAATGDIQGCIDACQEATASGCVTELGAFLTCVVNLGCAHGFDNIDNSIEASCGAEISRVAACDPGLTSSASGMGGTDVTVQPGQGQGGGGSTPATNDVITQACNSACQIALIGGCAAVGDQTSCVQDCAAQGQTGPAAVVTACGQ